jgi:hypothetical protein
MTNWVVLVPRSQGVANQKDVDQKPSLIDQAKAWIGHAGEKLDPANIVCADDVLPTVVLASPGTTLYLMGGHGKEGRNHLTWPGESNPLCCHQIGDLLSGLGLPTTYAGNIKVYSCLSADGKGTSVAFAKLLSHYLAHLGYRRCRVWGYTGAVSKGYVNSGTAQAPLTGVKKLQFKVPEELGQGAHRYATTVGGYGVRAKVARRDFTVAQSATPSVGACNICGRT